METSNKNKIQVCKGPRCSGRGADKVYASVKEVYEYTQRCECLAKCPKGPNASVNDEVINFCNESNVVGKIKRELRKTNQSNNDNKEISNSSIDNALDDLF